MRSASRSFALARFSFFRNGKFLGSGDHMAHHRLDAAPDTVHWGYFDAGLRPLLTVNSGDTVTISTVSGMASQMPKPPLVVPPALAAIHKSVPQKLPGHICTGPVAVRGAKAGQVLEVRIKDIQLHYDWGYNMIRPLAGGSCCSPSRNGAGC